MTKQPITDWKTAFCLLADEGADPVVLDPDQPDQENDYHLTWLAPDFETFVRGLLPASAFNE